MYLSLKTQKVAIILTLAAISSMGKKKCNFYLCGFINFNIITAMLAPNMFSQSYYFFVYYLCLRPKYFWGFVLVFI